MLYLTFCDSELAGLNPEDLADTEHILQKLDFPHSLISIELPRFPAQQYSSLKIIQEAKHIINTAEALTVNMDALWRDV